MIMPSITKAAMTGPTISSVRNSVPDSVVVAFILRLAISSLASANSSRMSSNSAIS